MRKKRKGPILLLAGIWILLSCILLGRGVVMEGEGLNGKYGMQKVLISVKNQADRENSLGFTAADIHGLREALNTEEITYTAQSGLLETSVMTRDAAYKAKITGTNAVLPLFQRFTLLEGSFFTAASEEEGGWMAVIDEELAWNIFKSVHVLGKSIRIFDTPFKIIGVIKKQDSILNKLSEDGLAEVYIPGEELLALDKTAKILSVQVHTPEADTLGKNEALVSEALQQIGKNPVHYSLRDYNILKADMEQRPRMVLFAAGISAMLLLLYFCIRITRTAWMKLRARMGTADFLEVLKNSRTEIGLGVLKIAGSLAGVCILWRESRFRLYIPPSLIPGELIDLSYYVRLFWQNVRRGIQNRGYIAPTAELLIDRAQMFLGLMYFLLAALGFLLTHLGLSRMESQRWGIYKTALAGGTVYVLAWFLALGAWFGAGLPYAPETGSILALWASICIHILYFNERKESVYHV